MINTDAFQYLQNSYKNNFRITNSYFKSITVKGVTCPAGVGVTPTTTTILSVQLPTTQGILLTDSFLWAFERMGTEFLTFGLRSNGNYIPDYNIISGAIVNLTTPFSTIAVFDQGNLLEITCTNYSGLAGFPPATPITIMGYVQGYRFQVLAGSGYKGLGA